MKYIHKVSSPLGEITLLAEEDKLLGLWFLDQNYYGGKDNLDYKTNPELPIFKKVEKWLQDYFDGKNPNLDFKLEPVGTEFQVTIWRLLLDIPMGKTLSYAGIASKYAKEKNIKTMSARGVGAAIGKNPISLIIPCHRVIGSNGKLTGYAGGLEKKEYLLKHEKAI